MPIPKGSTIKQKLPAPIVGVIDDRRFNDATDRFEYHVAYANADGDAQAKWFDEAEFDVTAPPPEKPAEAEQQVVAPADVGTVASVLG